MLDGLVAAGAVHDDAVIDAMRTVPRHAFLPGVRLERAYADDAVVTRRGTDGAPVSSASQPAIVARMLEQLDVRQGHKVLEIGAGTGYNAALLAHLAGPDGIVHTVDIDPDVAAGALAGLSSAGAERVAVHTRDGWLGVPEAAPFDRLIATVGVWDISPAWIEQLAPGGRIVVPLWLRAGLQVCAAFELDDGGGLVSTSVTGCGFMRLRGSHAGPESYLEVGEWGFAREGDAARGDAELLANLLASARREAAPALPIRWQLWLALGDEAALLGFTDTGRMGAGILLDEPPSLAFVDGQDLLLAGSEDALERLHPHLDHAEPVDLERLRLRAVPAGRAAPPARWELRRPHHTFLIDTFLIEP